MSTEAYSRALEEAREHFGRSRPEVAAALAGAEYVPGEGGGRFRLSLADLGLEIDYPSGTVTSRVGGGVTVAVALIALHYLTVSSGPLDLADPVRFSGLPGATAYVGAFRARAEEPLMKRFGGDGEAFERAVRLLAGEPLAGTPGTWIMPFLPHLPLGVRLGLAEEGLPADCVILFPRRAGFIYHAEDLAVAGEILAARILERGDVTTVEPVVLARLYDPMEAAIISSKLRSAGIANFVRHDALSVVYGLTLDGCGIQEILVRPEDLEEAQAALELEGPSS